MKTGILTDSGCNLNSELITEYGVEVMPLLIKLAGEEYISGVEIKKNELINKVKSTAKAPNMDSPSVGAFRTKYKELAAEYEQIISLHTASEFSSAVDNAKAAAESISDVEIAVIDTGTTSLGLGLLVKLAAQLRKQKVDFAESIAKIKEARQNVKMYLVAEELACLEKTGLVCSFKKKALKLLKIKPVFELKANSQHLELYNYVWGARRGERELQRLITEELADQGPGWVGLMYGTNKDKLSRIQEELTVSCSLSQLGMPLLGKVGPKAYGAAVLNFYL